MWFCPQYWGCWDLFLPLSQNPQVILTSVNFPCWTHYLGLTLSLSLRLHPVLQRFDLSTYLARQFATKNLTLPLSNIPLIHRFVIPLGISGWRSRLCTIVFGLGVYLVVSALISTRKINFPTYDPLQQFRNLPPGDSSSLVARSLNSDTETHVSTTKIHSVDSQSPALRHHHHPRNLAAAIDHVQQKR